MTLASPDQILVSIYYRRPKSHFLSIANGREREKDNRTVRGLSVVESRWRFLPRDSEVVSCCVEDRLEEDRGVFRRMCMSLSCCCF